jgi:hypothetical protein
MHSIPVIFADVDWVKLATFLIIATIYVINLMATKLRERQVAKNRPARVPRQNPDTAKELEEFLKKSAAPRRDKPAEKNVGPMSSSQARVEPRARAQPQRRQPDERDKRRRPPAAPPKPATLVSQNKSEPPRTANVAPEEHLKPSIDTGRFAERAAHLGHLEGKRTLEQHLEQTFSHQVGTLTTSQGEARSAQNRAAAAVAAATGSKQTLPIAALLSGGNLRNAIVLNEIISRPEHRW